MIMKPLSTNPGVLKAFLNQVHTILLKGSKGIQNLTFKKENDQIVISDFVSNSGSYPTEIMEVEMQGFAMSRYIHTIQIVTQYEGVIISSQECVFVFDPMKSFWSEI